MIQTTVNVLGCAPTLDGQDSIAEAITQSQDMDQAGTDKKLPSQLASTVPGVWQATMKVIQQGLSNCDLS